MKNTPRRLYAHPINIFKGKLVCFRKIKVEKTMNNTAYYEGMVEVQWAEEG